MAKKIILKSTGRVILPEDFRKQNQCVFCGRSENINYGSRCATCESIDYKFCEICEIVLREGIYDSFSYDIREIKRVKDDLKISKELVREFVETKVRNNRHSDCLCVDCKDWVKNMSDICPECGGVFFNNKEHYKRYGNMCDVCLITVESKFHTENLEATIND